MHQKWNGASLEYWRKQKIIMCPIDYVNYITISSYYDCREELEKIDKQMTSIMLKTEQPLSPDLTPFPLSVLLLELINSVRLVKRLRNLKQAGNTHEVLDLVSRNPGLDSLERKSVAALIKILTETRTELKKNARRN